MLVHHFETFLSTLSFSPLRKFFLQHFIFSIQEIQTKTEAGKKMAAASFIDFKNYRDFKKKILRTHNIMPSLFRKLWAAIGHSIKMTSQ